MSPQTFRAVAALVFVLGLINLAMTVFAALRATDTDVERQWVVGRYVTEGDDPWLLARSLLDRSFPTDDQTPETLQRKDKLYTVRQLEWRSVPELGIVPEIGPPDSTYPPSSSALLLPLQLFTHDHVVQGWVGLNLLVLAAAVLLAVQTLVRAGERGFTASADLRSSSMLLIGLFLLWPPLALVLDRGQFGFVTLFAALALLRADRAFVVRAILYSLLLLKPSLGIPLFAFALIRRDFAAASAGGVVHLALFAAVAAHLGRSPVAILRDWLSVSGYLAKGMYTAQDFINGLGWQNTLQGVAIQLGIVAAGALFLWAHRRATELTVMSFLASLAAVWMYHDRYDFVILLLPVIGCVAARRSCTRLPIAILLLFGILPGMTDAVFSSDEMIYRALRWTTRLSVLALPFVLGYQLRCEHRDHSLTRASESL